MKKTLLLMVAGATLMASCSKETMEADASAPTAQMSMASGQSEVTQITNFLSTYESWKINSNTPLADMTKEDAVWLMEASINYKNAFQFSYWEDQHTSESDYFPSVSSTNVLNFTGASILNTFAAMDVAIQNQVQAQSHDMVLLVDLFLVETNSDQIGMRGVSANALPLSSLSSPLQIGSADYWYAGTNWGKCASYSGQNPGENAAERTEDIVNHNWWYNHYRNSFNPQDVIYHTNLSYSFVGWGQTNCDPFGNIPETQCIDPTGMVSALQMNENSIFCNIPSENQLIVSDIHAETLGSSEVFHNSHNDYGIPHVQ
ncbi:MAG: hypothetical protein ACI8SA_000609 [Dokdonia sp.]|jgi:hypothetical protein